MQIFETLNPDLYRQAISTKGLDNAQIAGCHMRAFEYAHGVCKAVFHFANALRSVPPEEGVESIVEEYLPQIIVQPTAETTANHTH